MTAQRLADRIIEQQFSIAHRVTERHFREKPELGIKYGTTGREKSLQDVNFHLSYLAESIRLNSEKLFTSYIDWTNSVLESRNVPTATLLECLTILSSVCSQVFSDEDFRIVSRYITIGIQQLQKAVKFPHTYLTETNPLFEPARQYLSYLLAADRAKAKALVTGLLEHHALQEVFEHIFQATQYEIGLLWQTNKITVAHEHFCTAATQQIMSSLYPLIFNSEKKGIKMMACSVSGDLHELGIRMVSDLFEQDGWDSYFLGANMPDLNIVTAVKEQKADLLALSVTMPFHIGKAERLINKIRNDAECRSLKIIVGGYTFNSDPQLWTKLGADGTAHNGREALLLANELMTMI